MRSWAAPSITPNWQRGTRRMTERFLTPTPPWPPNGEPPEAMLMVWNWEHDAMVSHTAKVKALLEMEKK